MSTSGSWGRLAPIVFFVPLVSLAADQKTPPPQFPAATELVRLDVVVRAKDGAPIRDLRPDEIQVFERGQRCAVSSFRLVQVEPEPTVGAPADVVTPPVAATPLTSEPRAANETAENDAPASIVALVFDSLSLDPAIRARDAALTMLQHPFPAGTWFTVAKIGWGLQIVQPLTSDASKVPAAVRLATAGAERALDAPSNPRFENATDEMLSALVATGGAGSLDATSGEAAMAAAQAQMAVFTAAVQREARSANVFYPLVALSRSLSNLQGRKTMLLFSEGLTVTAAHLETMSTAISEANRANLTIYGFDARGLTVDSPFATTRQALAAGAAASRLAQSTGKSSTSGVRAAEIAFEASYMNAQGNLQNVADSTGGFLVANTNDLRAGLEKVAGDLRSYYEVAYVPPDPRPDGKWREIQVKVARPGVRVRSRKGYFAMPPGKPVVRPSDLPLVTALEQSPLPRALQLRAATIAIAGSGPTRDTVVIAEVPLSAARFTLHDTPEGQRSHGRLSLLGLVRDEAGRLVTKLTHDAPFDVPPGELPALRRQLLVTRRTLSLPAGRYVLEVAALDRGSARIGARRVPFEVVTGEGFELGGLAMADPQPAPKDAEADDPLRVGDKTAVPRLGRPVVAGVDPSVGVYLTLQSAATPSSLTLEVRHDGQVVGRAVPELPRADATGRIAYVGTIAADRFTPGRYELRAVARQGDAEAIQATAFDVVAREQPTVRDRAPAANEPAEVTALREKAGRYVLEFQEQFRSIVAEETSRQWAGKQHRELRSDLVFVTLPGEIPWATFRDVFEVDGRPVRERQDGRLQALLAREEDSGAMEQALAIARESARHNLGPLYRTINVPTLALTFLHPAHQWRFRWQVKGRQTFFGHDGVELRCEEVARPTLVRGLDDSDVPVKARYWIEQGTGRVLRSELEVHVEQAPARTDLPAAGDTTGWVTTQYRPEPSLGLWVPDEMTERHENVRGGGADFDGLIRASSRYANHRRFGVDVTEGAARLADEPAGTRPQDESTRPPRQQKEPKQP